MTPEHDPRPRPQYGEYADPAAQAPATPPVAPDAPSDTSNEPAASDEAKSALGSAPQSWARGEDRTHPGAGPKQFGEQTPEAMPPEISPHQPSAPVQPAAQQPGRSPGPLPGVPHNLGAKGSSGQGVSAHPPHTAPANPAPPANLGDPANQTGSNTSSHSAAHATNAPAHPVASTPTNSAANATSQNVAGARPNRVDRIVTIMLLAVGSYFALSMALTLSQFTLEFSRVAEGLGVEDFVAPPMLNTLGTVGAILVLAIYAIVLIFSIRRLRARKLTFWAPLAAGALAWVVFFVLFFIGLNQSAELWQALLNVAADPVAAQQMLESLNSNG